MSTSEDLAHLRDHIAILPAAAEYADQMEALQALVYGVDPRDERQMTFNAAHFRQHLHVFPEGQFIAVDMCSDTVVGVTVSMRIAFDPRRPVLRPWWELTGYGWLSTHVPTGTWMYGVESSVHPNYRGFGIGRRLMDARKAVLRRLNLRGMVAGSAIIDYHKVADHVPVETYVADVVAGRRFDTNLSKQLKMGFRAHAIIPNYLMDWDCQGYGVEIIWENPDYVPVRPVRRPALGQSVPLGL
jgi:GNAT superfamily N-acetyltransferase